MERGALSHQQVDEALHDSISYSPNDLVLADWSAALVYDTDAADTVAVLEFLNVQLVELRFLDTRLACGGGAQRIARPRSARSTNRTSRSPYRPTRSHIPSHKNDLRSAIAI